MSKALITESILTNIANAIRTKLGVSIQMRPGDMPAAIMQIGGEPALQTLVVSSNGEYEPDTGYVGFDSVDVDVPNTYTAEDEGKVVSSGALIAQTARASAITVNGTYDTTNNNSVTVNVSGGGGLDGVYSPTFNAQYASSSDGGIVVHGHHAVMTIRLNSITNKQTSTPIGTVPSAIKPAGIVYLRLGNGGNTGMSLGKITPDGDIYLTNTSLGGSYAYTYAEWDIPDSAVDLVINNSSVVTSVVGKIAVIGDMCTLCCEMTLAGSNGWANNIFSIPASLAPPSTFTPCGVFYKDPYMTGSSMSPETKDSAYSAETRGFNVWLPRGSNKGVFRACWPKGT